MAMEQSKTVRMNFMMAVRETLMRAPFIVAQRATFHFSAGKEQMGRIGLIGRIGRIGRLGLFNSFAPHITQTTHLALPPQPCAVLFTSVARGVASASLEGMSSWFRPFRVLGLIVLSLGLLPLTSCDRVKTKIKAAVKELKSSAPAQPTTAEEEAMNKTLENPNVFDPNAQRPKALPAGAGEEATPEAAPAEPTIEVNKSATVAILGYHDFRDHGGTPMMIAEPKFRQQMEAIRDSKIPVIPLSDVLAWKRGEKSIPEEAICITMDDGWVGVYQYAYPILKELGFPFTVYLYKKYVNIGGRSMKWEMIKEMIEHGCEVASHTVSHELLTKKGKRTDAEYELWLLQELKDSKEFLEQHLGKPCLSIGYPYGNHSDTITELAQQVGYEAGVTVANNKVTWDTPNFKLGRYIIHGEQDGNFRLATTFHSRGELGTAKSLNVESKNEKGDPLVQLSPAPNSTITERRPVIEANLLGLGSIVPESIRLRIGGYGMVPAEFDPKTFVLRYKLPSKLRREDCNVTLMFKRDAETPEEMVTWRFKVDLSAAYLPVVEVKADVKADVKAEGSEK